MRRTVISMCLAVLMAGAAWAQNQNQGIAANSDTPSTKVQNQKAREVLGGTEPEQRIQREVLHELLMLPYYSVFDDLKYEVNGNTVTLMGAVVNPTVKSDAEGRVKHIEGVQNVVNNIKVLPPSSMDDQIRREEYRAIYGSDGLYRYAMGAVPSIHIIVDNGHVTLTGMVDNQADKNDAKLRASSVPGVLGQVQDDLQVANSGNKGGE
jgi:hyperosmotically inducible periplasmic protein